MVQNYFATLNMKFVIKNLIAFPFPAPKYKMMELLIINSHIDVQSFYLHTNTVLDAKHYCSNYVGPYFQTFQVKGW
jgi:hypothetical protein